MSFVGALASVGAAIAEGAAAGSLASTIGGGLAAGTIGNTIGAGAMLGSTLGGVTSAATGQDIGKGMGMGALTGAVGGGLSAGLGSLAGEGAQAATAAENAATNAGAGFTADSGVNIGANTASAVNPSGGVADLAAGPQTYAAPFNPQPFTQTPIDVAGNVVGQTSTINPAMGAATQAPETMANKVGDFALQHPIITSTVGSMGANALMSPMFEDNTQTAPGIQYPNIDPNKFKYNAPQWQVYQPKYYAGGGITDLDASNGIPPVQMMASGGFTGKLIDNVGNSMLDPVIKSVTGWDDPSEIPLIGGLFNKPEAAPQMATLSPEEKQKLMAMLEAKQQGQVQPVQPVQTMAKGGISDLGGYSDGGRLLKGPGDGVSDDIPAQIGEKQPARLADGEFVIPARIVSELGNGSTDAGAKRLYQMMDRINSGRAATTKKGKFAEDTKAYKHLPA